MPELGRAQIVVYGAVAIAVLLLGSRWVGDSGGGQTEAVFGTPERAGAAEGGERGGDGGISVSAGAGGLVVHVAGEVADPGVYRMPAGSRVTDAIERAGGPTGRAAEDAINLAATLADGQQVVVPARAGAGGAAAAPAVGAVAADAPISLGTATVEQLDTIEGIGPVTAADIVEFRDSQGGVGSIDELDQISGIGPATMEALRARLQP